LILAYHSLLSQAKFFSATLDACTLPLGGYNHNAKLQFESNGRFKAYPAVLFSACFDKSQRAVADIASAEK
jgi:hypothetical protein